MGVIGQECMRKQMGLVKCVEVGRIGQECLDNQGVANIFLFMVDHR